ncbi:MAG: hypothetical protein PHY14_00780 [Candidatus Gracilibacteria bacterium]|nr:hypothetical protein [Candidatus Gracilibacteria bacterium]
MGRGVHEMGDSFELELQGGDFALVTTMPSGLSGIKVVTVNHGVFFALGIPTVSNVPEGATCGNCTNPNFRPKRCPRRPDEEHFIVGGDPADTLALFARKAHQICPGYSDEPGDIRNLP